MHKQILMVQTEDAKICVIAAEDFAVIGEKVYVSDFECEGVVVDQISDYGGDVIRFLSHNSILYAGIEKAGDSDGDF